MIPHYIRNFPIQPKAVRFWNSQHKCNRAKVICAYSLNEANARRNFTRMGWSSDFARRAVEAFGMYCATPSMDGIPFSTMDTPYWECMPYVSVGGGGITPPPTKPTLTWVKRPLPMYTVDKGDVLTITATAKTSDGSPTTTSWSSGETTDTITVDTSTVGDFTNGVTIKGTNTKPSQLMQGIVIKVEDKPVEKGSINFDPNKPADVDIKHVRKAYYSVEYGSEY